ncbi:Hypothetical predicted protein [Lecanosticta acicola]|uniref:NAD(P)-binding domain-containing protein n=1 Tax=Lecanosticta acicola TaxID=111012 RepID=A0AAI9EDX0_9PEZI|nr:Hypothetical predicted protein [Lecanosticta acicola]
MPKFVLLGATGATGSAVLRSILNDPPQDLKLDILVRSEARLRKRFSELPTESSGIRVLEGQATDASTLRRCCYGASTIFACVGANESKPGMSLVYDTANAIVTALRSMQSEQGDAYRPPIVVQLRTASLNDDMARHTPAPVVSFVKWALYHTYLDISRACALYEAAAQGNDSDDQHPTKPGKPLLRYVYADPPTLHDPDGVECTGYKLIAGGPHPTVLSYADLGAALYELGRRPDQYANQALGVIATGKPKETWFLLFQVWLAILWDHVWRTITQRA